MCSRSWHRITLRGLRAGGGGGNKPNCMYVSSKSIFFVLIQAQSQVSARVDWVCGMWEGRIADKRDNYVLLVVRDGWGPMLTAQIQSIINK